MPRRRIPNSSVPRRLDRRRPGGNATGAQHRPHRGRHGQVEKIAERRVRALELRTSGASFREIARQLGADVHTVHGDIQAELAALRETTVGRAEELRALELERCDQMVAGFWPKVVGGNPPAVLAAVRVSERRSRLLGLDEPTATRTEISGSLSVDAQTRIKTQVEELRDWLSFEELRELGEKSEKLFADARALVMTRRTPILIAVSPSPAARVADGEPTEQSTATSVTDQGDRADTETTPRDSP
jgi:hypothetical protein